MACCFSLASSDSIHKGSGDSLIKVFACLFFRDIAVEESELNGNTKFNTTDNLRVHLIGLSLVSRNSFLHRVSHNVSERSR